jgi:hypothetical protein
MSDCGLDWEYTRTEFLKALIGCGNASVPAEGQQAATNDVGLSEELDMLYELQGCSLLMLNFRDRLSLKQQKALTDLAAACAVNGSELRDDLEWDEEIPRS